jgi:hypothetical protein
MKTENENLARILEKLRKLMDLKESAIQCGEFGEANAAAAGITRLLREYDLTMQDIPSEQKEKDPVDMEIIPFKFMYMNFPWYWNLLNTIAHYNNARIILHRHFDTQGKVDEQFYKVIGRKKNREIVLYLISFLCHQFIRLGQKAYPKWKYQTMHRTGLTPANRTTFMKSYLIGCVFGLDDKLESEQKAASSEKLTALIKVNKAEIDAFIKDMNVKKARQKDIHGIDTVMVMGLETGRNVSLHEGLEGNTAEAKILVQS